MFTKEELLTLEIALEALLEDVDGDLEENGKALLRKVRKCERLD